MAEESEINDAELLLRPGGGKPTTAMAAPFPAAAYEGRNPSPLASPIPTLAPLVLRGHGDDEPDAAAAARCRDGGEEEEVRYSYSPEDGDDYDGYDDDSSEDGEIVFQIKGRKQPPVPVVDEESNDNVREAVPNNISEEDVTAGGSSPPTSTSPKAAPPIQSDGAGSSIVTADSGTSPSSSSSGNGAAVSCETGGGDDDDDDDDADDADDDVVAIRKDGTPASFSSPLPASAEAAGVTSDSGTKKTSSSSAKKSRAERLAAVTRGRRQRFSSGTRSSLKKILGRISPPSSKDGRDGAASSGSDGSPRAGGASSGGSPRSPTEGRSPDSASSSSAASADPSSSRPSPPKTFLMEGSEEEGAAPVSGALLLDAQVREPPTAAHGGTDANRSGGMATPLATRPATAATAAAGTGTGTPVVDESVSSYFSSLIATGGSGGSGGKKKGRSSSSKTKEKKGRRSTSRSPNSASEDVAAGAAARAQKDDNVLDGAPEDATTKTYAVAAEDAKWDSTMASDDTPLATPRLTEDEAAAKGIPVGEPEVQESLEESPLVTPPEQDEAPSGHDTESKSTPPTLPNVGSANKKEAMTPVDVNAQTKNASPAPTKPSALLSGLSTNYSPSLHMPKYSENELQTKIDNAIRKAERQWRQSVQEETNTALASEVEALRTSHQSEMERIYREHRVKMDEERRLFEEKIAEAAKSKGSVEELEAKIASLKLRMEQDTARHQSHLEKMRVENEKEVDYVTSECEKLVIECEEQITRLEQQLEKKKKTVEGLSESVSDAKTEKKMLEGQLEQNEVQLKKLKHQIEEDRALALMLEEKIANMQANHKSKFRIVGCLRAFISNISGLMFILFPCELFFTKIEAIREEEEKRQEAIKEAKNDIIKDAQEQFAQANEQYKRLKAKHSSSLKSVKQLEEDLKRAKVQSEGLVQEQKKKEAEMKAKIAALKKKLERVEDENGADAKKYTLEIAEMREKEQKLRAQLEEVNKAKEAAHITLDSLMAEKNKLKKENDELQEICNELMVEAEQNQAAVFR